MKIEVIIKISELPKRPRWAKGLEPNTHDGEKKEFTAQELFARKVWEVTANDLEMLTCRVQSEIDDLCVRCFLEDKELEY